MLVPDAPLIGWIKKKMQFKETIITVLGFLFIVTKKNKKINDKNY